MMMKMKPFIYPRREIHVPKTATVEGRLKGEVEEDSYLKKN